MRQIDFKYEIIWTSVDVFDYRSHENDLIKYDAYLNMESKVKYLASILNKDIPRILEQYNRSFSRASNGLIS